MSKIGMFRAQITETKEWVEGFYTQKKTGKFTHGSYQERFADCIITYFSDGGINAQEIDPTTLEYLGEHEGCEYCTVEECRNPSGRIFYKQFPHNTDCLTTLDDAQLQLAYDIKSGWVLHFQDVSGDRMFDVITHSCPNCGKHLGEVEGK